MEDIQKEMRIKKTDVKTEMYAIPLILNANIQETIDTIKEKTQQEKQQIQNRTAESEKDLKTIEVTMKSELTMKNESNKAENSSLWYNK